MAASKRPNFLFTGFVHVVLPRDVSPYIPESISHNVLEICIWIILQILKGF